MSQLPTAERMVQGGNRRPHWIEAAQSAFAVASALPAATLNSMQIAELFEKVIFDTFRNFNFYETYKEVF